ncbi:DnaB-like helicase N-terminal domain-containing protein [Streptomyces sp. NPDC056638]|uniref:DnaB-like helicase N-terminal domain-containing protein n=1 Tax=Streptomyces sp. NPDC056638 TaxID=3345887 RepID=UPI0036996690
MANNPVLDEDFDQESVPAPPPVHYVEQALLGSLLLDPRLLADTGPLKPDHFGDRAHAGLFAAMRAVPAPDPERHMKDPVWLNTVLERARPEAPGLTVSYLHALVQVSRWTKHAGAYALMIRADHARRTLKVRAEQLARTATDITLPNPATATLAQADALTCYVDELAGRFAPHPGSLPRPPMPAPPPRDTGEEALEEERLFLATATAHPTDLTAMRWLQSGDFAHPLHGALFQCVTALMRRGDPVDPITVLWEAQHHGLLTVDTVPADLISLVSTPVGSPEHWGERILQRALLAQAHTVALRIAAFADDPAKTPHQLTTGSRRALADFTAVRTRWQRATAKPAQPSPLRTGRARPTTRAGPTPRATAATARVSR